MSNSKDKLAIIESTLLLITKELNNLLPKIDPEAQALVDRLVEENKPKGGEKKVITRRYSTEQHSDNTRSNDAERHFRNGYASGYSDGDEDSDWSCDEAVGAYLATLELAEQRPNEVVKCPDCGERDCGGAPRFASMTSDERAALRERERKVLGLLSEGDDWHCQKCSDTGSICLQDGSEALVPCPTCRSK